MDRTPTLLRVAVVVGDDVRVDAARIPAIIDRANATLGWRYGVRFVLGELTAPAVPSPGRLIPTASSPGIEILQSWQNTADWRDADVVVAVLWNSRPRPLQTPTALEVALWGPTEPELLVLARKGPALVETPQEAYEKAATLEFCQAAADRVHSFEDAVQFEQGVYGGLARVAGRRWRLVEGVDRLFCPVCGAESWVDGAPSTCIEHGRVLLFNRHRAEGIGADNLLGVAFDGGRYPLHGRIGGGSFGAVYFSKRQPDGLAVAVKVLRRQGQNVEVKRFEREVRLLEQIDHPNVVKVHDHGWEREGPMYAVMDYLPGRTLADVLHLLDPRTLVDFLMQVLDGLSALHERGMVHRDLKPANIMLVDDPSRPSAPPRPVLIDLGLGKHREALDMSELTQHGMAMGTHNYMAPEQFERAHDVDHRADLYSIAVILYRGLTGDPPFDFRGIDPVQDPEAWTEKWKQLCTEPPPVIDRDDLPEGLLEAVSRGLGKRPEDRFQSAAAFRAALAGVRSQWRQQWMDPSMPAPARLVTPRPQPVQIIAPPKPFPGTTPVPVAPAASPVTAPSAPPESSGNPAAPTPPLPAAGGQARTLAVVAGGLLLGATMVLALKWFADPQPAGEAVVRAGTVFAQSELAPLEVVTAVAQSGPATETLAALGAAEKASAEGLAAQTAAERAAAEKLAAQTAAEKAAAEKLAAQRAAEQAAAEKLAVQKATEKAAAERAAAEKAAAEKLAAQTAAEKLAAQTAAEKLAAQKTAEQAAAEKLAAQKAAAEKLATQKAAEQAAAEKLAAQRAAQRSAEQAAAEKLAAQRAAEKAAAAQRSVAVRAPAERASTRRPPASQAPTSVAASSAPTSEGPRGPTSDVVRLANGAEDPYARVARPEAPAAPPAFAAAMDEASGHIAARRTPEGIAALERALALRPQAKEPHQVLCRVRRMAGQQVAARKHCEAWRRLETSDSGRQLADAQLQLLGR